VAVGSRADLVLVRRNPLGDIAATSGIDGVILRGRWLDADTLVAMAAGVP
jgi:imidazolonepropionase-like amidohydrolase